jgi:hypothetical protein
VSQGIRVLQSKPHQILLPWPFGVEREAEDGLSLECLGEPAESLGASAMLTALDPRDHR